MVIKPRSYQKRCVNALFAAYEAGNPTALFTMATALGKTYTAAFFLKRWLETNEGPVLFLCHQNYILKQLMKKIRLILGDGYSYGLFTGVTSKKGQRDADILFATLQSMTNWRSSFPRDRFKLVFVDEAHHSSADTYEPTIRYFQSLFTVAMTATPYRDDGRRIQDIYGEEVFSLPLEKGLARRLLSPVRYSVFLESNKTVEEAVEGRPLRKLSVAKLNRSFFNSRTEDEIAKIIAEKVNEVPNAQAMIFASDIAQCRRINEALGKYLTDISAVHYEVDENERTERLEQFREGKLKVLTSRDMLNEGIDVPEVTHVIFLRATNSIRLFEQQLGRGLRKAFGKALVHVLDFVGNCERLIMLEAFLERLKFEELEASEEAETDSGANTVFDETEVDDSFLDDDVEAESFVWGSGDESRQPKFAERVEDLIKLITAIRQAGSWTKDEALQALREVSGGRPLSQAIIQEASKKGLCPGTVWLTKHFDPKRRSVIPAIRAAGLVPVGKEQTVWTIKSGLAALRKLAGDERRLSLKMIQTGSKQGLCPSSMWCIINFDPTGASILPALRRAGLTLRGKSKPRVAPKTEWDIESGLEALRKLATDGSIATRTISEASKNGLCPNLRWLKNNFDPTKKSIQPGLTAAGLKNRADRKGKGIKWKPEDGFEALRKIAVDGTISVSQINEASSKGLCPSTRWITDFDPEGSSVLPGLAKAGLKPSKRWK